MSDPIQNEEYSSIIEQLWPEEPKSPFSPKFLEDFVSIQKQSWLIKNLIPKKSFVVIYGAPGSGKTFAALDIGMSIARPIYEWCSHKVKSGRVVYICAEGKNGFKNRVMAYMMRHDLQYDELNNFNVIDEIPNLLSLKDPQNISQQIGQADLVIFDTLACIIPGGDENSAKDMSVVINNCKFITEHTHATVMLIHHSGKNIDNGARGWSGLLGAVDTEIKVEALGTTHTLTVTKQKEGEAGKQYGFFLPVYNLGEDEDGDPITSCTFEHSEVKIEKKENISAQLGGLQKIIMDVIKTTPERPLMIDDIAGRVVANMPYDPSIQDQRKKRFFRSLESLQEKEIISISNNIIYVL